MISTCLYVKKKLDEEVDVLREISKVQQANQRKHRLMKLGRDSMEQAANDYFKPVVLPLKQLANQAMTPMMQSERINMSPKFPVVVHQAN